MGDFAEPDYPIVLLLVRLGVMDVLAKRIAERAAGLGVKQANAEHLVGFIEKEFEQAERDREAINDREAVWKFWGTDRDGKEFEATLTVYSGTGSYRVDTETVWGSHMGQMLIHSDDPRELKSLLNSRGLTRVNWDRQ